MVQCNTPLPVFLMVSDRLLRSWPKSSSVGETCRTGLLSLPVGRYNQCRLQPANLASPGPRSDALRNPPSKTLSRKWIPEGQYRKISRCSPKIQTNATVSVDTADAVGSVVRNKEISIQIGVHDNFCVNGPH